MNGIVIAVLVLLCCLPVTCKTVGTECYNTFHGGKVLKWGKTYNCSDADGSCVKQVYNNGTVVRGCDTHCKLANDVRPQELYLPNDKLTLYCCYSELCNGASITTLVPALFAFIVAMLCF
ncbi:hypothetical protein AAVH_41082 [Aphelenchoides avenae]|nr:hypothetical protein AAVH_41082 [Aphelenchus avenae]